MTSASSDPIAGHMTAARHHVHGDTDVMLVEQIAVPEPGPGEALVRVAACALNHLDLLQRRGPALIPGFTLPHTPGMDIAGTIEAFGPATAESGPGNAGLSIGSRVVIDPAVACGQCPACAGGRDGMCAAASVIGGTRPGGYAEYVVVPITNAYVVPDEVDLVEAACVPTVWMTASHALHVTGRAAAGETALITGGGSGVSTAAIQLAVAAGLRVIATVSSPTKVDYAKSLGAHEVIDSSNQDLTGTVRALTDGRGVDLALDHVGPAVFNAVFFSLAPRGRLVFFGNTTGSRVEFDLPYAYHFGLQLLGSDPYDSAEFAPVLEQYWSSSFVTPIDSEFALADVRAAHDRLESRHAMGKVVLRP